MHHLNSLSNLKGKSDQYQVIRSQLKRKQIPVCKDIKGLQMGSSTTQQVLEKFMIILLQNYDTRRKFTITRRGILRIP